jgi:hypothetical protein
MHHFWMDCGVVGDAKELRGDGELWGH